MRLLMIGFFLKCIVNVINNFVLVAVLRCLQVLCILNFNDNNYQFYLRLLTFFEYLDFSVHD